MKIKRSIYSIRNIRSVIYNSGNCSIFMTVDIIASFDVDVGRSRAVATRLQQ